MPKRSSTADDDDLNTAAFNIVAKLTGQPENTKAERASVRPKNPAAVALGRLGGKKGGKARAKALSAEERSAIAKAAAEARWKKK